MTGGAVAGGMAAYLAGGKEYIAVVSGNTDSVTGLTLAGWWRRLGASMIDGLVILVVMFVLSAAHSTVPRMLQAVIFAAYHGIMLATNGGRTIGNLATGTRVISANGQAIDPAHAAIRAVVDSVCGIIVIGSIVSAFMIGLHPRKQAIHDLAASTIVVLS